MIAAFALVVALVTPSCWRPPVEGPVVRGFEAPACTWCAGHRGLEYRPPPGTAVLSAAPGTVVFAGPVVGTIYVTLLVSGGRKVTYGDVRGLAVRPGDRVAAGQVLAHSAGRLLLTVRLGAVYEDPAPLLGRWEGRPRLVPTDGATPRPAPMPRFTCATGLPAR
ncbi:MAG: hypothetical protein RJA49_3052 [Actinomycetota bacterium]